MTEQRGRILVVDDEEQIRHLMERMLTPLHYEVVLARDGMEALDKVKKVPPDVILLDIMMPKMWMLLCWLGITFSQKSKLFKLWRST
jgi:CheY-like chemotaxis protein